MMKIGIVGLGVVGKACKAGFEKLGHDVAIHDILLKTNITDVLQTEIVYVTVPTPSNEDGSCDTSIVEDVIHRLRELNYDGVIAIKSTVTPGTTQRLIDLYDDRILFVPEFLKERSAEYDFIFDHTLLVIGSDNVNIAYKVIMSHGDLPKNTKRLSPTEAEMVKYYHNSFNAVRVVFANVMFELCDKLGISYDNVKDTFLKNNNIPDEYLDVTSELRGYAGACLPKDVNAMNALCKKIGLPHKFFEYIDSENKLVTPTVFDGMRK